MHENGRKVVVFAMLTTVFVHFWLSPFLLNL